MKVKYTPSTDIFDVSEAVSDYGRPLFKEKTAPAVPGRWWERKRQKRCRRQTMPGGVNTENG